MKIRSSFVTNSSSTCYLISCTKKNTNKHKAESMKEINSIYKYKEHRIFVDAYNNAGKVFIAGTVGHKHFDWKWHEYHGVFTKFNWLAMQILYALSEDAYYYAKDANDVFDSKVVHKNSGDILLKSYKNINYKTTKAIKELNKLEAALKNVLVKETKKPAPFDHIDFFPMLCAITHFGEFTHYNIFKNTILCNRFTNHEVPTCNFNGTYNFIDEYIEILGLRNRDAFYDFAYIDHQSIFKEQLKGINYYTILSDPEIAVKTGNDNEEDPTPYEPFNPVDKYF